MSFFLKMEKREEGKGIDAVAGEVKRGVGKSRPLGEPPPLPLPEKKKEEAGERS